MNKSLGFCLRDFRLGFRAYVFKKNLGQELFSI